MKITGFTYMTAEDRETIYVSNPDYVSLYTLNGVMCLVYSVDKVEISIDDIISYQESSRQIYA